MPGDFRSGTPAIDRARSFFGVAAKKDLEEFLMRIAFRNSAANVAAANVVLASPEKKQSDASGHDVVILHGLAWRRANPAEGFGDWLAVGGGGSGVERDQNE